MTKVDVKKLDIKLLEEAIRCAWPAKERDPQCLRLHLMDNVGNSDYKDEYQWVRKKEWCERLKGSGLDAGLIKILGNDMKGDFISDKKAPEGYKFSTDRHISAVFRKVLECAQFKTIQNPKKIPFDSYGVMILDVRTRIKETLLVAYYMQNKVSHRDITEGRLERINKFATRIADDGKELSKRKSDLKRLETELEMIKKSIAAFQTYRSEYDKDKWLWDAYAEEFVPSTKSFESIVLKGNEIVESFKEFELTIKAAKESLPVRKRGGQTDKLTPRIVKVLAEDFDQFSGWWLAGFTHRYFLYQRATFVDAALGFLGINTTGTPRIKQLLRKVPIKNDKVYFLYPTG